MGNKIVELDSKSELEERLRSSPAPALFIENKNETPNHFLLIESNKLTVGLATYFQGIKAQVALVGTSGSMVIGHEKELICCSPEGPSISWRLGLDFCFHEFKVLEEMKAIVVIDEISISLINFAGEKIWYRPSPDVIEWFNISNSEIAIRAMNGHEIGFDTKTGKILYDRTLS